MVKQILGHLAQNTGDSQTDDDTGQKPDERLRINCYHVLILANHNGCGLRGPRKPKADSLDGSGKVFEAFKTGYVL